MARNPNELVGTWLYKLKEQDNPGSEHFGFAAQLPEQNVRREVHIGYHPDPSIISFVICREYLKHLDPGLFQRGLIRDKLEQLRVDNIKWRQDCLKALCKKRNIDPSLLASPPERSAMPKFGHFGPKYSLTDKATYLINDIFLVLSVTHLLIFAVAFGILLLTLPFLSLSILEKLGIAGAGSLYGLVMITLTSYFILRNDLIQTKIQPKGFPVYGRLSMLLKDLKEDLFDELSQDLPVVVSHIKKSRMHPERKAYSISVTAYVILKSNKLSALIKPEKLKFHIEIVGQNLGNPSLLFYWFEPPRSIFLARSALKAVDFIKCRINRMHQHVSDETKLTWNPNKLFDSDEDCKSLDSRLKMLAKLGVEAEFDLNN